MFSDSLGYWRLLDRLTVSGEWQKLRQEALWGNNTFRITCESDPRLTVGWVWIRQVFPPGTVTQALRYYPKEVPEIIELIIPPDLQQRNVTQRAIEVCRRLPWKLGRSLITNPVILKIEELAGM